LDCSPVSSFFYALHADELVLLPGICIGSCRKVRSIYCVSAGHPSTLAGVPIAVTRESATGRALFATICEKYYGFAPDYIDSDDPYAAYAADGSPCILIGDKAIDAYLAAPSAHAFDIGELWTGLSGQEMVYAVWAVRRDVVTSEPDTVDAARRALTLALDWGERNIDEVVRRAQAQIARPPGFYDAYYAALNFRFDRTAQTGLSAFFEAASACALLASAPALEFVHEVTTRV